MAVISGSRESRDDLRRRRHDFTLLWIGSAVSSLGTRAGVVAYPLLALAVTGSPVLAGWIRFANAVPNILLYLPVGVLVDRRDRRRLMLGAQIGRGIAVSVVAVSVLTGSPSVPVLICAAAVEGSLAVVYSVAETAAIPQIVPEDELSSAFAKNHGAANSAVALGQPLGGLLFGVTRALPFVADALSYVISTACLLCMRTKLPRPETAESDLSYRRVRAEVAEGFGWLWRNPFLRTATVACTCMNLLGQVGILLLIVLAQDQGASPGFIGLVLAGTGVGGIVGSLAAPRIMRRAPREAMLGIGTWAWFAALLLVVVASQPGLLLLAWAGVGLVGGIVNVATAAYQAAAVPERMRGRVASAGLFLAFGALPLGALLGGYLIATVGAHLTAIAMATVMGVIATVTTLEIRRMRR